MARRRKGRALNGVLILDKPQGLTSNAALQRVRKAYGAQKAGHTGSLDPLATGVLPVCFGEATKFSQFLLNADKGYFTTATLGEVRDTGDSEGELVKQSSVPRLEAEALEQLLARFRGQIDQVPSMYSALKHQGRPLYEWARKGVEIDRPARAVRIDRLELTGLRDREMDLTVECSKGTYIRSLVEDIGQAIGCGAHVSMLRRFKAGHFLLEQCHTLEEIEQAVGDMSVLDAFLLPVDALLLDLPDIFVNSDQGRSILHGQAVRISRVENTGICKLYIEAVDESAAPTFIGVAELDSEGNLVPKRLVNFEE
ncbi:MAG: tRNA pseudouridine(55) synthase TruB [Oleiphilus sp.]|nr:MAG: tRNA pseudouridine(55) synthase TruB [Oleiphilus sp.]